MLKNNLWNQNELCVSFWVHQRVDSLFKRVKITSAVLLLSSPRLRIWPWANNWLRKPGSCNESSRKREKPKLGKSTLFKDSQYLTPFIFLSFSPHSDEWGKEERNGAWNPEGNTHTQGELESPSLMLRLTEKGLQTNFPHQLDGKVGSKPLRGSGLRRRMLLERAAPGLFAVIQNTS